jgi:hypothetical protein
LVDDPPAHRLDRLRRRRNEPVIGADQEWPPFVEVSYWELHAVGNASAWVTTTVCLS